MQVRIVTQDSRVVGVVVGRRRLSLGIVVDAAISSTTVPILWVRGQHIAIPFSPSFVLFEMLTECNSLRGRAGLVGRLARSAGGGLAGCGLRS